MGAVLKHTVVAGGVKYSAGTPATPELREIILDRHWSTESAAELESAAASAKDIAELRELAAREIESRENTISKLRSEVEILTEENADLREQLEAGSKATGAADVVDSYKGQKATQLSAEIANRNADRDPDGDAYIRPASTDERADLLAALQADDARTAGA